jgi:hypothetical protein
LQFLIFVFRLADPLFKREPRMRRIDLVAITLEGWSRLDDRQRQRFAEMFLRAAVRLGGTELRRWLRRRVRTAPLALPIDPARYTISDAEMALLLNKLPLRADDADGGTGGSDDRPLGHVDAAIR